MQDQEILTRVAEIDLSPIVHTLVDSPEGPRWSIERTRAAELWYRRFLFLSLRYPDATVVPTKEIDEVWHTHILDTTKYFADCDRLFGRYFHHFPYFGIRGHSDRKALEKSFSNTLSLFRLHFGAVPSPRDGVSSICTSGCSRPNGTLMDFVSRPGTRYPDVACPTE